MLIRLIGVRFTHLVHGTQQLDLFEDTPEMVNLYLSLDRIRKRYGKDGIKRAIAKLDNNPKKEVIESEAVRENRLKANISASLPPNPPERGTSGLRGPGRYETNFYSKLKAPQMGD